MHSHRRQLDEINHHSLSSVINLRQSSQSQPQTQSKDPEVQPQRGWIFTFGIQPNATEITLNEIENHIKLFLRRGNLLSSPHPCPTNHQ
jgi:hypothetical protein